MIFNFIFSIQGQHNSAKLDTFISKLLVTEREKDSYFSSLMKNSDEVFKEKNHIIVFCMVFNDFLTG